MALVDVSDEVKEIRRLLGDVKVGPGDVLNLSDESRRFVWVVGVGEMEGAFDGGSSSRDGSSCWFRGGEEESSSFWDVGLVDSSLDSDGMELHRSVGLIAPVVSALDLASLVLLGQPAEREASESERGGRGRGKVRRVSTHMTITRTFCSQQRVQKSRYVEGRGP